MATRRNPSIPAVGVNLSMNSPHSFLGFKSWIENKETQAQSLMEQQGVVFLSLIHSEKATMATNAILLENPGLGPTLSSFPGSPLTTYSVEMEGLFQVTF